MKLNSVIYIISLVLILSGCSSLTKTQTKAINQYFQTINNYSEYPIQINNSLSNIKLNRAHLYPSSFSDDSVMIEALVTSLRNFKSDLIIEPELQQAIQEVDHYIKDYFLLIPNGFNAIKILESATVTVAGFFGLSRVASGAFSNVNSVKISRRKAEKIKSHIKSGNSIVNESCAKIEHYINTEVKLKLNQENKLLKVNYQKFLKNINREKNSYDYYANYNSIFIEQYKIILNTEVLSDKLLEVSSKIKTVQQKLSKLVDERQKLESNMEEIHELYILISEFNRVLTQFETIN